MAILTTEQRCVDIVRKIAELCNRDGAIAFERDFDDFCLTVYVTEGEVSTHTHCGIPELDKPRNPVAKARAFRNLVESLHNTLHGGPGLSWHPSTPSLTITEEGKENGK